jgi:hypothetical protein
MMCLTISVRYIFARIKGVERERSRHGRDGRERVTRTVSRVRTQRQVVDYALQRRALLADVHAGRVAVADVCDATPYLLQAARFHGEPTEQSCPVCRKERVTLVSWIFGDALRQAAGSARRPDELERLAALHHDFSVHVVEVCRSCRWNHLVSSYVLGTDGDPDRRRSRERRQSAAE